MSFRDEGLENLKLLLLPLDAQKLEKAIYKHTYEYSNLKDTHHYFVQLYNTKLNELLYNLNQRNSPYLLVEILEGKVDITLLPYMSAEDLNTYMWAPIKKRREYINNKKNNKETTDAYKCPKCKNRKTVPIEMQTRSADEPMTIIITCQVCMHRWMKYG